jgi:hypothetical protein
MATREVGACASVSALGVVVQGINRRYIRQAIARRSAPLGTGGEAQASIAKAELRLPADSRTSLGCAALRRRTHDQFNLSNVG